jgi:hypothetical protein
LFTGEPIGVRQLFWDYQEIRRILENWGAGLPSSRVHVITVPQRSGARDVLWRRFASVLGLDRDLLPSLTGPEVPPSRATRR